MQTMQLFHLKNALALIWVWGGGVILPPPPLGFPLITQKR